MSSSSNLKKTKNINGEDSVASSLNSIVKKQFTNMAEQYNLYASAINEMEEKIKELKHIMLSETFLKNCQHFTLDNSFQNKHIKKNNTFSKNNKNIIDKNSNDSKNDKCDMSKTSDTNENDNNTILTIDSNNVDNQNVIIETKQSSKKIQYFTPSQSNSLFWCFYIIYNGFSSYEYESNYFTAEQQFKFQTIEKVKKGDNKTVFKENKISKTSFESGLMGNTNITAKTLYALCLCYNVNIFYVYKNTYYEMITNTDTPVYIIKYNTETNNYSIYMPVDTQIKETPIEHKEYIENIKQKYWKLDNLEKPLRPITIYSVNDLVNICSKLDIDIICEKTKKRKTKAELYSSILQSL